MDILKDRVKPLYFKYLVAASGSAMVASIFGMIDAMMVGKYHVHLVMRQLLYSHPFGVLFTV